MKIFILNWPIEVLWYDLSVGSVKTDMKWCLMCIVAIVTLQFENNANGFVTLEKFLSGHKTIKLSNR
jgi:hypothetical protein